MPPVDWPIIQSLLLTMILPGCGVAAAVLAVIYSWTRSEFGRSAGASLAFIAGLATGNFVPGLAAGNWWGELVPFWSIHRIVPNGDEPVHTAPLLWTGWQIETGWYSLFSATLLAILAEVAIEWSLRRRTPAREATRARVLAASVCAAWLIPWSDLLSYRSLVGSSGAILILITAIALLAAVIWLNTEATRFYGQSAWGYLVPLAMSMAWCGSAAFVLVLSHSAKFADLAIVISCAIFGVGLIVAIYRQRPKTLYAGPATFIPALMLGGTLNTYSDIPFAAFALIGAAPALTKLLCRGRLRNWFETRPLALLAAFLIPCGIAVGLAMRAEL
jgi:uncharacterized membrane protein